MKRRLFTLAAAVSLGLCMATVGLWVRSYWRHDELRLRTGAVPASTTYVSLHSSSGLVLLSVRRTMTVAPFRTGQYMIGHERRLVWVAQPPGTLSGWGDSRKQSSAFVPLVGAGTYSSAAWGTWRYCDVYIPYWIPGLLAAVLCIVARHAQGREHRLRCRRDGHCPTCGYDLRATRERCPECGKVVVKGSA